MPVFYFLARSLPSARAVTKPRMRMAPDDLGSRAKAERQDGRDDHHRENGNGKTIVRYQVKQSLQGRRDLVHQVALHLIQPRP
jgi:hypothetical protein